MWSTWKGPPDPGRLSKLCASRAAYPCRFARGWGLRPDEHPLSEQVVDENGAVAIWTRPARSQGSAEQLAGFTAADADEPLAAAAAFVNGVSDEHFTALKFLAHQCQIGGRGLMAEPVTVLLVSSPTVLRACRRRVFAAHQAAALAITRTLTYGHWGCWCHGRYSVGDVWQKAQCASSACSKTICSADLATLVAILIDDVFNALRPLAHQRGAEHRVRRRCRCSTQMPRRPRPQLLVNGV